MTFRDENIKVLTFGPNPSVIGSLRFGHSSVATLGEEEVGIGKGDYAGFELCRD